MMPGEPDLAALDRALDARDDLGIVGRQLRLLLPVLHDRGVVNEVALLTVLQDLRDGQPLTRDHLTAIFGVAAIYAVLMAGPGSDDGERHAQLDDIREILIGADDWDAVVRATLQLVAWLREDLRVRPRLRETPRIRAITR